MKVFVVNAIIDYECATSVAAFTCKKTASDFIDRCFQHDGKKPLCPEIDSDWSEYEKKYNRWEKNHPAKYIGADNYSITELSLKCLPINKEE